MFIFRWKNQWISDLFQLKIILMSARVHSKKKSRIALKLRNTKNAKCLTFETDFIPNLTRQNDGLINTLQNPIYDNMRICIVFPFQNLTYKNKTPLRAGVVRYLLAKFTPKRNVNKMFNRGQPSFLFSIHGKNILTFRLDQLYKHLTSLHLASNLVRISNTFINVTIPQREYS